MDCTTGFHLESYECVPSQIERGVRSLLYSPSAPYSLCPFPFSQLKSDFGLDIFKVVQNPFSNHLVEF